MSTGWRMLKWDDRIRIDTLRKAGKNQSEIAKLIGVNRSTVSRELKRGKYIHTLSSLEEEIRYSPEMAQQKRDESDKNRGTQLKIGKDHEYANYLEKRMLEGLSPAAVLGELEETGKAEEFNTKICTTTLYSYIDKEVFLNVTNKDLTVKCNKKHHKKKVIRRKRDAAGTSIEKRPEEAEDRENFGNWEMDSVVGPQGKSSATMLTMTERKTRNEIVVKLPNHTAGAVVDALDNLERKWGDIFPLVFRTITVDNGVEFSFSELLERSVIGEGKRTQLYYCHPYCSSERGTNENHNRMIRRKIPKGVNFDNKPSEEIEAIAEWMNNYPRKILKWSTPAKEFEKEINKIKENI